MSRDPEPPIAEELRASGISLSYADWADVHAGRYERVADRVLRQARWMARVAIVGRGVLVILLVYDLVRYFRGGPDYLLFLAGTLLVFLWRGVPRAIELHRTSVSLADRLRRAAADAPGTQAVG